MNHRLLVPYRSVGLRLLLAGFLFGIFAASRCGIEAWAQDPRFVPVPKKSEDCAEPQTKSEKPDTSERAKDGTAEAPEVDVKFYEDAARQVIQSTNTFRKEQGLEPVARDERLMQTARDFAAYMARTKKYGHRADGRQPWERAKAHGYDYCMVSENIAYQEGAAMFSELELAEQFVTGWKESPEHRKNMVDPDVTEIGVALAKPDDADAVFAVQLFGLPKSAEITFAIVNRSRRALRYKVETREDGQSFRLLPNAQFMHERCRATTVTFRAGKDDESVNFRGGATFTPSNGTVLTVRGRGGNTFEVTRRNVPAEEIEAMFEE